MTAARGRGRPAAEQVGAVVERLSTLLAAGLAPPVAWHYLAQSLTGAGGAATSRNDRGRRGWSVEEVVCEVAGMVEDSVPAGDAIESVIKRAGRLPGLGETEPAWRTLGSSWVVATEAGAPLARSLGELAVALGDQGAVDREVAAALSGPAASTALVTALPLASLGLGSVMGLDSFGVLFGTPAGGACLVAGLGLLLAGRVWSRALVRRARVRGPSPGLGLDLLSLAVGGGSALPDAQRLVQRTAARFGLDLARDGGAETEILALAAGAGAAPGELLRQEAARIRRDAVTRARARATALGVWLMAPLGLCVLPSFLLLSVAPIVIGVLAQTGLVA